MGFDIVVVGDGCCDQIGLNGHFDRGVAWIGEKWSRGMGGVWAVDAGLRWEKVVGAVVVWVVVWVRQCGDPQRSLRWKVLSDRESQEVVGVVAGVR